MSQTKNKIELILHYLRSAENVGAIFRTAEAVGVAKLWLVGTTPAPLDRFGRVNQKLTKASLGAEKLLVWEAVPSFLVLLKKLKTNRLSLVALEQSMKAVDYRKAKYNFPLALVVGNEAEGLPAAVLKQCDQIIFLPMLGQKESLNVATATGIALYHLLSKN